MSGNEATTGLWDWSKNKAEWPSLWKRESNGQAVMSSYFTVGLRRLGDEAAITQNAIEMLKDVFRVQRGIVKYHGSETAVSQVWALYEEVASYYGPGLNPPENVTILFPDDNAGNEAACKGGNGVYFHLEYVGLPRSYKWGELQQPAKDAQGADALRPPWSHESMDHQRRRHQAGASVRLCDGSRLGC